MNPRAILALQMLRAAKTDFSLGYACGLITGMHFSLEPWEACYLDNIKTQYLKGSAA